MKMTITEHLTESRPTDADLVLFQELIQGKLPEDYKAFLKNENGGRAQPGCFRFKTTAGDAEDAVVHYFYALYDGRIGNIQRTFVRFNERIPSGYLPIASDTFGNLLLLGVASRNAGKVYFWDHEEEQEIPTLKNMSLVADSFSQFVALLEEMA
jgi:hypothetical protein